MSLNAMQPTLPFESKPLFVRHPRARRYVIRVASDGTVRVTAPRWGSKRVAAAFAEQQRAWSERQRRRIEEDPDEGSLTPDEERALRQRAKRELPLRLQELAAQHGLS